MCSKWEKEGIVRIISWSQNLIKIISMIKKNMSNTLIDLTLVILTKTNDIVLLMRCTPN